MLLLIWLLLFAASLYFLQVLLTMFSSDSQGQGLTSTDWAGYIVSSEANKPQVVGINASWSVPRIGVFSSDAYSSAWIGIGGQSEKTLIQTGTEHDSVNGQEYYYVWYEMLPATAVRIDTISVSPGDVITASITLINSDMNQWAIRIHDVTNGQEYYYVWYEMLPDTAVRIDTMNVSPGDVITASIILINSNMNQWAIRIHDVTNNQGFYRTFIYNSSRLSAEWIVERPHVNNQISLLANFGTLTFTDAYAKVGNTVGAIANFSYSQITMTTDLSKQLTSVSSLGEDGTSFSVTYLTS